MPRPELGPYRLPWLPPGRLVRVDGRGEFFVRIHEHPDPSAPVLLLLHGWTASADLQFFAAYRALAERWSFVAIDHRGHGRGLRTGQPFSLVDAADDAASVVRELGIERVVPVGFSMGGPISMYLTRRHRELVRALIVQATAMEWRRARRDRMSWYGLPVLGAILRSWWFPRYSDRLVARMIPVGHELEPYLPWIVGEMRRGDNQAILEAGRALRHHDASDWAHELGVPAGVLLTTRDRLVKPRKQRAMAIELDATVRELRDDHFVTMTDPAAYSAATVELIEAVLARST